MGRLLTGQGAGGGPGIDQRAVEGAKAMGKTLQDTIREQDNAKREKAGQAADAAATSEINKGDLAEAARRKAGKAATPTTMEIKAPEREEGESPLAYAARKKRFMATQQAAQARALDK